MENQPKRVGAPNFRLIERSLKGNFVFEDEDIEVTLLTSTDSKEDVFEIALSAKKKKSDLSFRVETRVALEQHSSSGHQYPHLQINNFASDEELMKEMKEKFPDYIKSYEIMLISNEPKGELDLTQQL